MNKTVYQGTLESVFGLEELTRAFKTQRKAATNHDAFLALEWKLESYLKKLQFELIKTNFKPNKPYVYNTYDGHRRKNRRIEAPHVREAVVERAIWQSLNPILEASYSPNSYCGITGKGTERCKQDFFNALCMMSLDSIYLKCDIYHFYESVDLDVLETIVSTIVKDPEFVELMLKFTYYDPQTKTTGIGIGHLLSQMFGNLYLNELDKYVISKYPHLIYFRYADDFIFLGLRNNEEAQALLADLSAMLRDTLHLTLSQPIIQPVSANGDFVGCRWQWRKKQHRFIRLVRESVITFYKKAIKRNDLNAIISYLGMAKNTHSYFLMCNLLPPNLFNILIRQKIIPSEIILSYHPQSK